MTYKVRLVEIDNRGEIANKRRRTEAITTPATYRVGALVFLRPGKLYRIEAVERSVDVSTGG